jgi:hypothetical protein
VGYPRTFQRPKHANIIYERAFGIFAPTLYLSSTFVRKASRSATEEEDCEYFSNISGCFVLGCQCFVARIYRDGQHFYWAAW